LRKISNFRFLNGNGLPGQFARFVQVGLINTVGTYLLYLALIQILPYVVAYSIGFVVGILFSASMNARYSFAICLSGRTLIRFVVIYVINFTLCMQLLIFCVEVIGIHPTIAPLVVLALFTPINFLCSRVALTGQWRRPE